MNVDGHLRGICAYIYSEADFALMKKAGIEWIRVGFPYPFRDRLNGELSQRFLERVEHVKGLVKKGFKVMGVTPLAGSFRFSKEIGKSVWHSDLPAWAGTYDMDSFYEAYREGCKEIGRRTAGLVGLWQISNEMDIRIFRGSMTVEQAGRFLTEGSNGVKEGNPEAETSINPAGLGADGRWLFETLYAEGKRVFDYAGIDGYFGSWAPGGPESWLPVLEEIHRITKMPVIIHEWGYSSTGRVKERPSGSPPEGWNGWNCYEKAWYNVWKKEHSEAEQAEFVKAAIEFFAGIPYLVGNFFFRWRDPPTCWQCGQPECPSECGWGLLNVQGKPKPAYYALKEAYEILFKK
ncbi:MAG: hypothetical protein QXZ70_01485 [Candidatus Bathyarchaeia archaeon]